MNIDTTTAREIALAINTLERRSEQNFECSLLFMTLLHTTRKQSEVRSAATYAAIAQAAAAVLCMAETGRHLVECHQHLLAEGIARGIEHMGGDDFPCQTFLAATDPTADRANIIQLQVA